MAGVYADEGTSGTVKKKRDGFLRLLQDCEAGKIDMLRTKSRETPWIFLQQYGI